MSLRTIINGVTNDPVISRVSFAVVLCCLLTLGPTISVNNSSRTTMRSPKVFTIALIGRKTLALFTKSGANSVVFNCPVSKCLIQELVSLIPDAHVRPSIPEYPEIADHIRQAIDEVYYGVKEPKEALDDAAAKSALILGW